MKTVPPIKALETEALAAEAAQAEFLADIRASLEDMQAGRALPADEALALLELGLAEDELESRLPE